MPARLSIGTRQRTKCLWNGASEGDTRIDDSSDGSPLTIEIGSDSPIGIIALSSRERKKKKFPMGTEGAFVRLRTNAAERRNRRTDRRMARRKGRAKDGGRRSVLLGPRESVPPSRRSTPFTSALAARPWRADHNECPQPVPPHGRTSWEITGRGQELPEGRTGEPCWSGRDKEMFGGRGGTDRQEVGGP